LSTEERFNALFSKITSIIIKDPPPVEKADSDATEVTGAMRMTLASLEKAGKQAWKEPGSKIGSSSTNLACQTI
jgi:hypothetical protein